MASRGITYRPRPTCRTESGADPEHERGRKGYEGEGCCGPDHRPRDSTSNKRRDRRVDRVNEAKTPPDEATGQDKADDAGGDGNKELQHIEFPELRSIVPLQYGTPE